MARRESETEHFNHHVHFREDSTGQWTPRSLFFDVQCDQIDYLFDEPVGELVKTDQAFTANRASSGTFDTAIDLVGPAEEMFRREAEKCDLVKDVIIYNSRTGGTGSGLT